MATIAEIRPGFILGCCGPQPKNKNAQGIEVQIGFSISAEGGSRSIICNYLVIGEDFMPRCNLLNILGIPATRRNRRDQEADEIHKLIAEPFFVQQDSRRLLEVIPTDLQTGLIPTTLDQDTLPPCRIARLAVI